MEDSLFIDRELVDRGSLHKDCSKIVLQCLWVARMVRPDLLWAGNDLARKVTKWTEACDKRLHRLISFMHHTRDYVQYAYVGDKLQDCALVMYLSLIHI